MHRKILPIHSNLLNEHQQAKIVTIAHKIKYHHILNSTQTVRPTI